MHVSEAEPSGIIRKSMYKIMLKLHFMAYLNYFHGLFIVGSYITAGRLLVAITTEQICKVKPNPSMRLHVKVCQPYSRSWVKDPTCEYG